MGFFFFFNLEICLCVCVCLLCTLISKWAWIWIWRENNKLRLIDKLSSSRFRRMSKLKTMINGIRTPSRRDDLVWRATRLKCPFCGSAVYLNVRLGPREDVPRLCSAVAGGQVVNLPNGQLPVPEIQVRQLADKRLSRVEASSQCVLQGSEREIKEES